MPNKTAVAGGKGSFGNGLPVFFSPADDSSSCFLCGIRHQRTAAVTGYIVSHVEITGDASGLICLEGMKRAEKAMYRELYEL